MKTPLLICASLLVMTAAACSEDEEEIVAGGGNPDLELTPDSKPDAELDARVFDLLNLDYPGLAKVKAYYEAGDLYLAALELREYYRSRSSITNPDVDLVNPTVTALEQRRADQALEYRFYIRNFQESGTADEPVYYNFKQGDAIDWNYKPAEITDQEFSNQIHRLQWMPSQAKAYRVTGNEAYVTNWIEVYKDWLQAHPAPSTADYIDAQTNNPWNGLQPVERAKDKMNCLPYFIQSDNCTPEWLTTFLAALSDEIEVIRSHYYTDGSNIYLSQVETVTRAGILMPEFKKSADWLSSGSALVSEALDEQFFADGVHNEFDLSYHMGVIADFMSIYNVARGNNKLSVFPSNYVSKLHNACRFFMDMIFPNYSMDNMNDTRAHAKSVILRNLRSYAEMFPEDKDLQWFASEGRNGIRPSYTSALYEDGGYYILRNGWTANSTMIILKNNTNSAAKWHCQPDNQTFALYRNGRNFLPDAGVYSYGGTSASNADRNAYAGSSNHNTMTRERANFVKGTNTDGRLLRHEVQGNTEVLVTENDNYADLTHRRAIFFVNRSFVVVVDEGYGPAEATVNLNWRLCPGYSDVTIDDLSANNAYGAHTTFADNNNMAYVTFAEQQEGFVGNSLSGYISEVLGEKTYQRRAYRVDVSKKADGAARFITVIYPFTSDSEFQNLGIEARFTDGTFNAGGAAVEVKVAGRTYNLSYTL